MVAARPKMRLIERQDLLLDYDVLFELAVDNVVRNLSNDLL